MYCRKCGNKIDEDSKFCAHCGEQISEATTSLVDEPVKETPVTTTETTRKEKGNTMLKITEIVLWVGVVLILFNLSFEEIDWWMIISAEVILFSGIAYIKEWFKNFEIPLVLMILGLLSNLAVFSIIDILLYAAGIYGIILKRKEYELDH
jgi:hypothetical protein